MWLGGLLTSRMRNTWSGQGLGSSLNCPTILVSEFWSTKNKSHKKSDFLLLFSTQGSLLLEHTLHLLLLLLSIIFFLVVPPGSSFYLQSQAGLRIKHTQNAIESLLCLVSPASPTLTSQMITASSHCILNSAQPGVTCNS